MKVARLALVFAISLTASCERQGQRRRTHHMTNRTGGSR